MKNKFKFLTIVFLSLFVFTSCGKLEGGSSSEDNTSVGKTEGYTLSLTVEGLGTVHGGGTFEAEEQVTITATPSDGYEFVGWFKGESEQSKDPSYSFEMPNYDLTILAKFKADLGNVGLAIVSSFKKPDFWQFIPEKLKSESRNDDTDAPNYESFVSVASVPQTGMGTQSYTMLNTFGYAESALKRADTFYNATAGIASIYQEFINDNPNNYAYFHENLLGFDLTINLSGNDYSLIAKNTLLELELYANVANQKYSGRIIVSSFGALKYEHTESSIKFAVSLSGLAKAQLELTLTGNIVTGVVYEFLGPLLFAAYIYIDSSYTTIIGNRGDFMLVSNGTNVEVYENSTGKFMASKVKEVVVGVTYNTRWFNLYMIDGIDNIKSERAVANGSNPDTIYVNNSAEKFIAKEVGILGLAKAASRRYDIEFKSMHFWKDDEPFKIDIPLLFVQEEQQKTLAEDIIEKNSYITSIANLTAKAVNDAVTYGYDELIPKFDELKENIISSDIDDYINS